AGGRAAAVTANTREERPAADDQSGGSEQAKADSLGPPQDDHRDQHRPQRLRRDERGDDGHAPAVERGVEAGVARAVDEAGQGERPKTTPGSEAADGPGQ